jgi:hypothetical protein
VTWLGQQLEEARLRVSALPKWRTHVFERQRQCEIELGYIKPLQSESVLPLTKS